MTDGCMMCVLPQDMVYLRGVSTIHFGGHMQINIYYGGRGLMDDPTLFCVGKMQEVLEELRVTVETYNLYELKNSITTLPQTLKNADGIILATTVEWHGIGGYMQQFLDACWLYGDKELISRIYMCPVVMATTYGEREGKLHLSEAWEILGGIPCNGVCGYILDSTVIENNSEYINIIERTAESLYRTINQHIPSLPASNHAVKQKISITKNIDLTPQESEQLSQYASDEIYVQRQKEDIQELTTLFRDMMSTDDEDDDSRFINDLKATYQAQAGMTGCYKLTLGNGMPLTIAVSENEMNCFYGDVDRYDIELQMPVDCMNEIVSGRMTFQRAFMSGDMTMKGDFKLLRNLDILFPFGV